MGCNPLRTAVLLAAACFLSAQAAAAPAAPAPPEKPGWVLAFSDEFDGKEIRRMDQSICRAAAVVRLSTAVMPWAGAATAALVGTSMDVDWVRVYKSKSAAGPSDANK
jgi:hypothetical protein